MNKTMTRIGYALYVLGSAAALVWIYAGMVEFIK